ncbi:tRNA uracil 4-sulfurtransferase ThiI [Peptoniphilus sp. oral taxon 386]|uniref:tRNA uracil 4-sulfurtransferase ThiI n=1 Tax=Peptoniphilus sp. oral taxon 386 TaxID=652713 RepID=UPI0001DA9BEC|nr:tRNA uracil 4-sulfurtransferase ThiI [Peptoniphilus sp. oral taxon 386]EFI42591.1 thiamine biosynthesis/tRNA modification protein ThiI [Peptoniphilus sp. oral taxon 386 str. F0131]
MDRVISISLGEVMLKGKNRKNFIDKIVGQVKRAIADIGYEKIFNDMGKIYILADYESFESIIKRVQHVFGIVYISPCIRIKRNSDEFEKAVLEVVKEAMEKNSDIKTFKAHTKRADKNYELKSMDVNNKIGGIVLKNTELKVDVHNPDLYVYCDVKEDIYFYTQRYKAHGGLPIGTNGRGLLLLSGGIDSPVAGFLMAKRGVQIDALHFHSYPFTSDRAEEKVHNLAKILSAYTGNLTIYSVNLLPIQKEINKNCPEDEMTIISRRFMMRIAEKISDKNGYNSIITGENLGQVASQTIDGLNVTNRITDRLIFRPLIGLDKVDIMDIAKKIGTYETSILPFEDCCTVFLPKHPSLKPRLSDIEKSEEPLNVEELVNNAISEMKIVKIKQEA